LPDVWQRIEISVSRQIHDEIEEKTSKAPLILARRLPQRVFRTEPVLPEQVVLFLFLNCLEHYGYKKKQANRCPRMGRMK